MPEKLRNSILNERKITTIAADWYIGFKIVNPVSARTTDNDNNGIAKYIEYVRFWIAILFFPPPNNLEFTDVEIWAAYETKLAITSAAT